ncbi:C2H2 transcription factor (Swi5) [Aspergillus bombycis]|uniref:C2H2 transcription factor (Swi5) n=1 Tax=Aspergillus bombycis TaxID=109264 RepID=A0A1F7ZPJ5_9EURO|nr:C2H2 transcription factor (Swi5) [Aspergillus bombycis]OGM41376.1 C2H2 transcription factor (Swi5) [Aspergillus bombycis]
MLSNPHRNLQERHRQHRRQISTPSALDAAKVPSLPAQAMHRYHAHRRGQSLDQRSLHMQRSQTVQDGNLLNTNAAGPLVMQQQHYARSTQPTPMPMMPECQTFSHEELQTQPSMGYMNPAYAKAETPGLESRPMSLHLNLIQQQQLQQAQLMENGAWDFYPHDNLTTGLPHQANAIPADLRRLSVQSDVSPAQRPHTPKPTHYLPITPATTPFKKTVDLAQYGGDMQPTPTKEQRLSVPVSAQPSYMQPSFEVDSFDVFDCQQGSSFEVSKSESFSSNHSSTSSSSVTSPFSSSSDLASMPYLADSGKAQKMPIYPATPSRMVPKKTPSAPPSSAKPKLSPRVASIDSLNLDARVHASIKETGVTIDEIASYIHGPDPEDGKWVCLHPGCERRFGRKENIKSHVQTHLGDRQYKCGHCDKCFVRGHDLKRHAKIHTGDKPYECLCGNVFARHDALTRHRQRGMCIGGYKGIVRKTTKRGRPRKHRPEMDERQEKSSRTRQRIAEKSSFDSSGSDTSRNSPPSEVFENMSLQGSSPVGEMPMFSNINYSLPPEVLTYTPPASPGGSIRNRPSPAHSHRSITPSTEDEMPPLSPSKRPLERIIEESSLPLISDPEACPYTNATSSTAHALSSPHTAPTLTDSSNGPDLDIFINQDPSTSFSKHEFPGLTDPDMAAFPDYVNGPAFDNGMDLFQGKSFSTGPSMGDDFFSFQFQMDEQPSDVMTREFFLE